MEKITSKNTKRDLRDSNTNKTTVVLRRSIMLLLQDTAAVLLSLLLLSAVQPQPLIRSPDSHVTIGKIQQTQDAANVLRVYPYNSRHAA